MPDRRHHGPTPIDWQRVDTVLLDMDGTLLDLAFDNHFWLESLPEAISRHRGIPLENAREDLFGRMKAIEGSIDWYCIDYWNRTLGFDVMALKHARRDRIGYRPGAERFLRELAASGRRRILVTNAHRAVLGLKFAVTGLEALLDRVISSHDYRVAKQAPAFWDTLVREEPFEPSRAVLLDDSRAVLRAARDWGVGQTVGIAQPDLSRPAEDDDEFPMVRDFDAAHP